jgi:hypothetical protein
VPELVIRRDVIAMGSIAAIAGIALAALLTLAFGARSSGPPADLKLPGAPAAGTAEPHSTAAIRRKAERKRHKPRRHAAAAPAPQAAPPPRVADTPTPATTEPRTTTQTQTVASPAPAPQPVRPLSRPKPSKPAGGSQDGVSFDDSG